MGTTVLILAGVLLGILAFIAGVLVGIYFLCMAIVNAVFRMFE